jgi:hypothetical protein
MKKNVIRVSGKSRVAEMNMTNIFYGAGAGIFSLWMVWVSTSALIHFVKG